jgi:hypothetical protein
MKERDLPEIRLDKTKIAVVPIDDDSDEIEYWQSASLRQRLQHIERLRRINYGVRATSRLQRVIRIIKCE